MSNRIEELKQFLQDSPQDPFLKYALTLEYKKAGNAELTLAGFEELVSLHTDYVGTYYHFAKYLEEIGQREESLTIYKQGMEVAQRMRNRHAYGELLAAYNLALGIEDDDWDD